MYTISQNKNIKGIRKKQSIVNFVMLSRENDTDECSLKWHSPELLVILGP